MRCTRTEPARSTSCSRTSASWGGRGCKGPSRSGWPRMTQCRRAGWECLRSGCRWCRPPTCRRRLRCRWARLWSRSVGPRWLAWATGCPRAACLQRQWQPGPRQEQLRSTFLLGCENDVRKGKELCVMEDLGGFNFRENREAENKQRGRGFIFWREKHIASNGAGELVLDTYIYICSIAIEIRATYKLACLGFFFSPPSLAWSPRIQLPFGWHCGVCQTPPAHFTQAKSRIAAAGSTVP